ncbi:MAG TPA: SGNH/GDSL hydrolase family protein, partial [Candidatus Melainabacteria bacterium]|nr:SGNH/GDSL hydrolase family protein [Candidatus Melainabacteria bacterium]
MTTAAPPKIENAPRESTTPSGKFSSKLAKWTILAITIVVWQIVALLVVEFTLAAAGLGEEEIFKLDPTFGFVHMNNKRVTWRSEGYARSYFGADGMREPGATIEKPAGVFRVALLGDSIVESLQVPIETTFGQILEKEIKKSASGKELQVLNFGNSGYSTAQENLQLKLKVLKYKPDAVIVFYNHRDLFENWSPPDQTLTNVRPYALHLPNQPLKIDSSSVTAWMKSPRGKFLQSISWLRENSRIWGLIAAWETQASFHDPVYRAIMGFFTNPVKTVQASVKEMAKLTPQTICDEAIKSLKLNSCLLPCNKIKS